MAKKKMAAETPSLFDTPESPAGSKPPEPRPADVPGPPDDLPHSWLKVLDHETHQPYWAELMRFVAAERAAHKVYPPEADVFNAFRYTPVDKVKAVILGQDPYHGPGQAHGLCFSVPNGVAPPPSLVNMFKELHEDIGFRIPNHGNLTHWAQQGVFLLNASLTVRAGEPMSHAKIGWASFTDTVIKRISEAKQHLVFLLWGKFAQEKRVLIDENKHLILRAAHPSPLSAHNGFFGCKH